MLDALSELDLSQITSGQHDPHTDHKKLHGQLAV